MEQFESEEEFITVDEYIKQGFQLIVGDFIFQEQEDAETDTTFMAGGPTYVQTFYSDEKKAYVAAMDIDGDKSYMLSKDFLGMFVLKPDLKYTDPSTTKH